MSDIVTAIGLVLVIEGLLWALVPHLAVRMLEMAAATPRADLVRAGWVAVALGVAVVWLVRG